jgi:hypothetical protein
LGVKGYYYLVGGHPFSSSNRFLISSIFAPPSLFNPLFDLFQLWNFSRYLYHTIHNQSGGNQHAIIGDGSNILCFNYLSLNTQFFDGLFGSLRELVALRSTHPQNFDLLHGLFLPVPNSISKTQSSDLQSRNQKEKSL